MVNQPTHEIPIALCVHEYYQWPNRQLLKPIYRGRCKWLVRILNLGRWFFVMIINVDNVTQCVKSITYTYYLLTYPWRVKNRMSNPMWKPPRVPWAFSYYIVIKCLKFKQGSLQFCQHQYWEKQSALLFTNFWLSLNA